MIARFLSIVITCLIASSAALGQPEISPPSSQEIQAAIDRLSGDTSLDPASRDAIVSEYTEAKAHAEAAARSAAAAAEFRRAADEAPQLLATIRDELARPAEPVQVAAEPGATLAVIEQKRAQAQAELQAARQLVQDLQAESARRNERRPQIPGLLSKARERSSAATDELAAFSTEGLSPELATARRVLLETRLLAATNEVAALEAEAASYDARQDLLPARRDRSQRRVTTAEAVAAAWQSIEGQRRQADAEAAAREAQRLRREAALTHPVLQEYASETERLAAQRVGRGNIPSQISLITEETALLHSRLARLRSESISISSRVERSGLNRATGLLLRRQLEPLEDERSLRASRRRVQSRMEEIEFGLITLQDDRLEAGDIDRAAQALLDAVERHEETPTVDRADLESVARELATARRDTLDTLITDSSSYSLRLSENQIALSELLDATKRYRTYIEERILWVRSIAGGRLPQVADLRESLQWLLHRKSWAVGLDGLTSRPEQATADEAQDDSSRSDRAGLFEPGPGTTSASAVTRIGWLAAMLLVLALVAFRLRSGRVLEGIANRVSSYRTDAFRHTMVALGVSLLAAAPLPTALWMTGWILGSPAGQPDVVASVALALQRVFPAAYLLTLLSQVVREQGLAQPHFKWPVPITQNLRRHLLWVVPSVIPLGVLTTAFDLSNSEPANAALGRICFTAGMLALMFAAHAVLRPWGPIFVELAKKRASGPVYRLRVLWYSAAMLLPLGLLIATWMGYYYTSLQLADRIYSTLGFGLGVLLLNGLFNRWLFIARRRVAIEDARRRREQAQAESAPDGEAPRVTESGAVAIDEAKLDLPAISAQTVRLFRVTMTVLVVLGLFGIWAQVLPALRMLDRVQIFPAVTVLDEVRSPLTAAEISGAGSGEEQAAPTNGSSPPPSLIAPATDAAPTGNEPLSPLSITLADLGLSIVILVITWAAFRNLPALAEMVVLQRLPLDPGSRYALSTVLRYLIAIVGVVLAFNVIGIDWTRVQWLAAALTFGLAFGMQEIFANFVSGLIILAERPFRIGDTVTIGDVSGTVTRIRMRATTISDFDRKELIIPNKTFITGDVINWTLSDPVLRLTVPVGVSYGSDIDLVERLLREIAAAETLVLADPAPQTVFLGFGDSTLDFELRVFIPHVDHRIPAVHALHRAITKRFREADVEIAFPQRDLHLRSIGDLGKLVERRADLPDERIEAGS